MKCKRCQLDFDNSFTIFQWISSMIPPKPQFWFTLMDLFRTFSIGLWSQSSHDSQSEGSKCPRTCWMVKSHLLATCLLISCINREYQQWLSNGPFTKSENYKTLLEIFTILIVNIVIFLWEFRFEETSQHFLAFAVISCCWVVAVILLRWHLTGPKIFALWSQNICFLLSRYLNL